MKKLSLIPLALIATLGAAWAATIIFPNTTEFARVPQGAGTIGGALYGLFNPVDGSARNSEKLAGKYASGYLQDRDCSGEPINKVWVGVDSTGRGICGRITTPLASIGKFTGLTAGVTVRKADNSIITPIIGTTLIPGDVVVTNGGTATITFTDDLSILRLDTNTTVALSTGENTSGQSVAQAILSDGRLWGRILTSTGVNLGGGGMVAGVRGTSVSVIYEAGTTYIAIPHSTQGGGAAHITCLGGAVDDMGPGEIINTNSSCQSQLESSATAGLYSVSDWVRSNTLLDINYLREHSTDIIAQNELMVTLPQSDERDPLCIKYDGTTDGRWFPSGYGCREKNILAMADYTTGTGTMITATSEYTLHKSSCGDALGGCTMPAVLNCNTGDELLTEQHGCDWPTRAVSFFPTRSTYGYSYDCVVPKDPTMLLPGDQVYTGMWTKSVNYSPDDQVYGGAKLSITCAKPAITTLVGSVAPYPGNGAYIGGASQYISYPIDSVNKAINSTLAGKTIKIITNGPGYSTGYLLDFGNAYSKVNMACPTAPTPPTTPICLSATYNTSSSTYTIMIPTSITPNNFIIGNNFVSTHNKPIGTTIKKITIQ